MSDIRFVCTSLKGNEQGVLKPDKDGYYTVVLGALNILNSAGMYYVYEGAKELFENSSQFMRRIKRAALRGEVGHPERQQGEDMDDFVNRYMHINDKNVCVQIAEIWLDFKSVKGADGKPVIAIMGKVTPSGVHGEMLRKQFENGKENVCFSIRCFTYDYTEKGLIKRIIKNIVTFDYVNEPGIYVAEKYKSPAMENLMDRRVTENQIRRAFQRPGSSLAQESAIFTPDELFQSFGWSLPKGEQSIFESWK